MDGQQLPGMPHRWPLRVTRTGDGRVVAVHAGPVLLSAFGAGDLEMRDLVICSLTEGSRFQGRTVAGAGDPQRPPVWHAGELLVVHEGQHTRRRL